ERRERLYTCTHTHTHTHTHTTPHRSTPPLSGGEREYTHTHTHTPHHTHTHTHTHTDRQTDRQTEIDTYFLSVTVMFSEAEAGAVSRGGWGVAPDSFFLGLSDTLIRSMRTCTSLTHTHTP